MEKQGGPAKREREERGEERVRAERRQSKPKGDREK